MKHSPRIVVDHAIALLGYPHTAQLADGRQRDARIVRSREAVAGAIEAITAISRSEASTLLGVGHTTYLQWLNRFEEWPPVLRTLWIERVRDQLDHGNIEETRAWWKNRK